jgi:hypothetical protein
VRSTATRTEAPEDAREVVGRLERWGLALLLALAGCDGRCGGSSVGTEPSPPAPTGAAADEAAPAAEKPLKEVRVTLADVQDIPRGELQIVDAPKYDVRKLGKPKVLMEGRHLRLPDTPWPLAPDRGFVLVQDGPGYESKVLEARLLDLRTGDVLATLRTLYRPTYAKLGVALGQAEVDGKLHEVLVHASDGQIVPLWPVEQRASRFVVINAGTGDAWVFEEQKAAEGAEEDPYPPYRYAYWGDLRRPPPEPKEEFARRLEDHGSAPGGWLGPTWLDPADAPRFLHVDSFGDDTGECAKVELRADGYECVPFGTWAMAGGWRGRVERDRPVVMSNVEKGERQVLELGEGCVIEEVTLDPPRAILLCKKSYDRFIWSPEKVVRARSGIHGVQSWSRNRRVKTITHYLEPEGVERVKATWLDMVGLQVVDSPQLPGMVSIFEEEWLLFSTDLLPARRYVKDPAMKEAYAVPLDTRACAELGVFAENGPLFISDCLRSDESVVRMELVDARAREVWPLPKLDGVWIMASPRLVIGLMQSSGNSRILRFELD